MPLCRALLRRALWFRALWFRALWFRALTFRDRGLSRTDVPGSRPLLRALLLWGLLGRLWLDMAVGGSWIAPAPGLQQRLVVEAARLPDLLVRARGAVGLPCVRRQSGAQGPEAGHTGTARGRLGRGWGGLRLPVFGAGPHARGRRRSEGGVLRGRPNGALPLAGLLGARVLGARPGVRSGGPCPGGARPWGPCPGGPCPGGARPWGPCPGGPCPGGARPWGPCPGGPCPGGARPWGPCPGGPCPGGARPWGPCPGGPFPASRCPWPCPVGRADRAALLFRSLLHAVRPRPRQRAVRRRQANDSGARRCAPVRSTGPMTYGFSWSAMSSVPQAQRN